MAVGDPFSVRTCAIAAIATGEHVCSLLGLRDKLVTIPQDSIYYHFWGGRLSPQFTHPEFHNDFAMWVHESLHDEFLAERLSILDPNSYDSLEGLRIDLVDMVEQRLDEYAMVPLARKDDLFHFVRSSLIVFDTPHKINHPRELLQKIPSLSPGSIFYHCIDARSRTPDRTDDFSEYLATFGDEYKPLIERIRGIDPYFLSLTALRSELIKAFQEYFEEGGAQ
jgi:hypothetical protein